MIPNLKQLVVYNYTDNGSKSPIGWNKEESYMNQHQPINAEKNGLAKPRERQSTVELEYLPWTPGLLKYE